MDSATSGIHRRNTSETKMGTWILNVGCCRVHVPPCVCVCVRVCVARAFFFGILQLVPLCFAVTCPSLQLGSRSLSQSKCRPMSGGLLPIVSVPHV
jgi:hypothetical protein